MHRRTSPHAAFNHQVTFHLGVMTLAARSETAAIERALPEVLKDENEEVRNAFFFMRHVLPITGDIDFHFNENTPAELLLLQDFWECRQAMANDYPSIWQLWAETMDAVVALEWWNTYNKRSSALRADSVFQATPEELAADPNSNGGTTN